MLEIEYTTSAQETANATLDFMSNRPLLAAMFLFMKICCILLCVAFVITAYHKALRPQDILALLSAIGWLYYYKRINRWIIKNGLQRRKFADITCLFKIDDKSILYRLHTLAPQNIEWKKLKYVLKNKDGYIIPLTGISNAGKFLWLPLRSLNKPNDEQEFLSLLEKFKLKIKYINT